jgi:hypothetical protein
MAPLGPFKFRDLSAELMIRRWAFPLTIVVSFLIFQTLV